MAATPTDAGVASLGSFTFACGQSIPDLTVAYETYGEFDGDNVVLVCHALTGSQNVARTPDRGADAGQAGQARAWWDDVVGPGKAIDTTEYYVVCANVPGSCYGTTGPASERPADLDLPSEPDHDRWGTAFPPVQVEDWARAQRRLLDHLGVGRLRAVVGGSVGGMNAVEWAKRYPDDVDRVVAIATAGRLDAQCLALDAVARRAIRADAHWNEGHYYGEGKPSPDEGLALARQIGHIMYLSKASMERKFGRRSAGRDSLTREEGDLGLPPEPTAGFFPYREVESYLDYQAEGFSERFDANSYLYLTRAMDDHDLTEGRGPLREVVGGMTMPALVIGIDSDVLYPEAEQRDIAERLPNARYATLRSPHGHDAFLIEFPQLAAHLRRFLQDL